MEEMSTKDLYLYEAMKLFAEYGFSGVGVTDIAEKVGCTTSALYKHYKNKQALIDAILDKCREEFKVNMKNSYIDFSRDDAAREAIRNMTEEGQIEMVKGIFMKIAFEEKPKLFRKLALIEKSNHPELGCLYNDHYVYNQYDYFSKIFKIWINAEVMRPGDPYTMAVQYLSPVTLAFTVIDNEPYRKDEILEMLENHVKQFNMVYRIK